MGRSRESSPLPDGLRQRGGGASSAAATAAGMSSTGSTADSSDPWVLVSGTNDGGWRSYGDETSARGSRGADADAVDKARSPPQPPLVGVPLPARLRDLLQDAVSKRRAVPRCTSCTQQIDTLWKRRAVCTGCEEIFCSTCCPVRKGKPRLCKACAAVDLDSAHGK